MTKVSQPEFARRGTRFLRPARLLPAVLVVALTVAGALDATAQTKIEPNAGTGPYLPNLQFGLTGFPASPRVQCLVKLGEAVESIKRNLRAGGSIERAQIQKLGKLSRANGLGDNPEFLALVHALDGKRGVANSVDVAIRLANAFIEVICRLAYKESDEDRSRLGALKWGTLFGPGSSYEFQSLTYSPGEGRAPWSKSLRSATYYAASVLVPVHGSGVDPVGRVGAGLVCGDPYRRVYGVSVASYLSPCVTDVEAAMSYRFGPVHAVETPAEASPSTLDELERAVAAKPKPPLLLDHIRPDDLWFASSARWITNSQAGSLADGWIFEGALTYAFRGHPNMLGTTLTASRIYSAQEALEVDEWGVELRTPIGARKALHRPIYFSARYGTRGHWTFAFEGRF